MKMTANRQRSLDATGVSLSVICILHCLLVPTAASAAPLLSPELGSLFGLSHDWHIVMLALAAPVSLVALGWGMKSVEAGWRIFAAGLSGLVLMAIGASHVFGSLAETVLTLTGVTVLAGAHLVNWRARARAGHVHRRDCGLCEHEPHA
jgi:hypothetical protein